MKKMWSVGKSKCIKTKSGNHCWIHMIFQSWREISWEIMIPFWWARKTIVTQYNVLLPPEKQPGYNARRRPCIKSLQKPHQVFWAGTNLRWPERQCSRALTVAWTMLQLYLEYLCYLEYQCVSVYQSIFHVWGKHQRYYHKRLFSLMSVCGQYAKDIKKINTLCMLCWFLCWWLQHLHVTKGGFVDVWVSLP